MAVPVRGGRMKLGINGRFLAAPVTGVQRFAHAVVRRIGHGADLTLYVPNGVRVPADIRARVVMGRLRGNVWEQLELPRAAARSDVILHPANTAPIRSAAPGVMVLHDVLAFTDPAWFARSFAHWQRFMVPRAVRGAARIVTVSEWSRSRICDATGVDSSRVLVAPQGLAPFTGPATDAAVARVRTHFGLPRRYVLAVGADVRKNAGFLLRMMDEWRRLYDDAPALVIAGASQRHVHGPVPVSGSSGAGDVRFLGRVSDAELHALYTDALVLCSPSHAEGLGRTPLEAIGCGTPAVAAPYGPAAETLGGLASARVVPLAAEAWIAAIRGLLAVPAFVRMQDSEALRARWTWQAAADVVLQACTAAHEEGTAAAGGPRARPRGPRAGQRGPREGGVLPRAVVIETRARPASPVRDAGSEAGVSPRPVRVALVHDWLTGTRGGERVLEQLVALLPGADLFTLFHVRGSVPPALEALRIRTSVLDTLPGIRHYYRYCLPLFPMAVERLDLSGYDVVVSSSHCVAKAVLPRGARHLCYCHTPMRYIWDQRDAYLGTGAAAGLRRALLVPAATRLRRWDAATADRVDAFVANSEHVRTRIRACYRRDARVIYPPVDVDRFKPASARDDVYVCAGALVPYKRIDLAIAAFNRSGRHLLVAGDGPAYRSLRREARSNITFTGRVSDLEMADILGRARALVMPMVEDFGIIAVEAQAAGAPVIAYGAGGALETVLDGITGVHFHRQTAAALDEAVAAFERVRFDSAALHRNAERFSTAAFHAGMRGALADLAGVQVSAPGQPAGSLESVTAPCT